MNCSQCGTKAPERTPGTAAQANVCAKCRFPLGRTECKSCGCGLFGGERYCPACGLSLKGTAGLLTTPHMKMLERYLPERVLERLLASESGIIAEKKYATVMFADVSGYTAMSEELSAENVSETMNQLFEGLVAAVHRYDGTVDKFIGDAVMALFGAPVAHDNDPERAVYAALEMMSFVRELSDKTGRKISLAVGINAGPLLAGSVGGHGRLNYSVIGDTVNTAQRLEAQAGAGRILVTKEVYQRVKDVVRFKTLPPVKLKGKRNPVDVWEARERRPRSDAQVRGKGVIGRKADLDALRAILSSEQGLLAALVGEAGVGRTTVVKELGTLAQGQGAQVFTANCSPYAAEANAGLMTEVIAQILKVRVDQGAGAVRDGKQKLVEMGLTEQEAQLLLAGALREKVDSASLDYHATLRAACAAFLRVLGVSAKEKRLLVVFEDVHWASPTGRAQLLQLLDLPVPKNVSLLLTTRPEGNQLLEGKDKVRRFQLDPLSRDDTRGLIADRLGLAVLDEEVPNRVFKVTNGNPRMIDELIQSFIDQGIVFRSRNRWIVSPKFAEAEVPPSLEGLVSARIDEVDVDAKRFVQAAAVVGTKFDPEVVRRVAQLQVDLEWVVTQLIDRRIVVADEGHNSFLKFTHESYRSVAEGSMGSKEAQTLHMRAGQYLQDTADLRDPRVAQAAAFHLASGPDHEKACKFLIHAARRLVEVHQVDSAIELLEKLLKTAAPLGYANYELSRCEVELDEGLYHLGMLYLRKGKMEESDDRLQWAYGRSRQFFNGDFRVWSLLGLAEHSMTAGRADQARKFLEMAAVDAEGMRDPGLLAVSLLERARLFNSEGDSKQALEVVGKALEFEAKLTAEARQALPQKVSKALILIEKGNAFHKAGNGREALAAFLEAHQVAGAQKDLSAKGQASLGLAKLEIARKDFAKAESYNADALQSFRGVGDRIAEGRCMHNFALIEVLRNNFPKAQEAARIAERIFAEIGHREGLALVAQVREMLAGKAPQAPASTAPSAPVPAPARPTPAPVSPSQPRPAAASAAPAQARPTLTPKPAASPQPPAGTAPGAGKIPVLPTKGPGRAD